MRGRAWDESFEQHLLCAVGYREFLKSFFNSEPSRKSPAQLTFQEFANRAGFSSKGFMADVLAGRKRLTNASLARVQVGLKLNAKWAEYLKCLVAFEESTERIKDEGYYREKIVLLKQKLMQQRSIKRLKSGSVADVFLQPNFPEIYAALGTYENGAALGEVVARTRLPEEQIRATLAAMASTGIVAICSGGVEDRYLPLNSALDVDELKDSSVFRDDFVRAQEKARQRFAKQASSNSALFMVQTFSVPGERLPELKRRLADVVRDFVGEAEFAAGDTIGEICLSFSSTADK